MREYMKVSEIEAMKEKIRKDFEQFMNNPIHRLIFERLAEI